MSCKIHKINKLSKASSGVILPKGFLQELEIEKGDFVEINKDEDKIIIKKLKV
jgi:antitoxin component of MazEF toxin-antitoxin module